MPDEPDPRVPDGPPDWQRAIRPRLARLRRSRTHATEPTCDAEIVEEVSQHLQDRYDDLRAAGATAEDACARVLAELNETEEAAATSQPPRAADARRPAFMRQRHTLILSSLCDTNDAC